MSAPTQTPTCVTFEQIGITRPSLPRAWSVVLVQIQSKSITPRICMSRFVGEDGFLDNTERSVCSRFETLYSTWAEWRASTKPLAETLLSR
jgi:hypothetical protein